MSVKGRDVSCCHPNKKIPSDRGATCPCLALELLSVIPPWFRTFLQWIPPVLSSLWLLVRPQLPSLNVQVSPCFACSVLGVLRLAGTPALHPYSKHHSVSLGIQSKEQFMTEPLTELLNEPAAHFAEKISWNEGVGENQ